MYGYIKASVEDVNCHKYRPADLLFPTTPNITYIHISSVPTYMGLGYFEYLCFCIATVLFMKHIYLYCDTSLIRTWISLSPTGVYRHIFKAQNTFSKPR